MCICCIKKVLLKKNKQGIKREIFAEGIKNGVYIDCNIRTGMFESCHFSFGEVSL